MRHTPHAVPLPLLVHAAACPSICIRRTMADYHTVYKGLPTDTTQWDDIQRRLGNLPARAPVWKPDKYTPEQEDAKGQEWLDKKDADELEEADDEFSDDRFLEAYRLKRMQELQQAVCRQRFGTVEDIRGAEFVQKVTEASRGSSTAPSLPPSTAGGGGSQQHTGHTAPGQQAAPDNQEGIWVVVQLYKDGHGGSALMSKCIDELAERYPLTKFVRIVSTDCIPNYPDSNLPTLLVYHNGSCLKHLVGLAMFGGQRATPEQVALILNQLGPVCSAGGEEDEEGQGREEVHLVKKLVQRIVADREQEQLDEDSDFD